MSDSPDDRALLLLKSRGALSAPDLADLLGMTTAAAQQRLAKLAAEGLIDAQDRKQGRGRPRRYWALTREGHARFPDRHSDLTLDLVDATRAIFGEAGLEQLIAHRETQARAEYGAALEGANDLGERLRRLAAIRRREGYMAEVETVAPNQYLLVENHCPICAAAELCQGFCRSELTLFREVLGPDVSVERTDHVLAGARRCAYEVVAHKPAQGEPRLTVLTSARQ